MATNCDPNSLGQAAKCFKCLSPNTLLEVQVYLLCQIVNAGGGGGGASFLSGNGSPVGAVTPTSVGQSYSDISNPAAVNFWVSTGLANTSWYEVAGS